MVTYTHLYCWWEGAGGVLCWPPVCTSIPMAVHTLGGGRLPVGQTTRRVPCWPRASCVRAPCAPEKPCECKRSPIWRPRAHLSSGGRHSLCLRNFSAAEFWNAVCFHLGDACNPSSPSLRDLNLFHQHFLLSFYIYNTCWLYYPFHPMIEEVRHFFPCNRIAQQTMGN